MAINNKRSNMSMSWAAVISISFTSSSKLHAILLPTILTWLDRLDDVWHTDYISILKRYQWQNLKFGALLQEIYHKKQEVIAVGGWSLADG